MKLTLTELKIILELGNYNKDVITLSKKLNLSNSQIYRTFTNLRKKAIIDNDNNLLNKTHINILVKLLISKNNLISILSDSGIEILRCLVEFRSVLDIVKITGIHKTTIHRKINDARKFSILIIESTRYKINDCLWSDLLEFFVELNKYENLIDDRIPKNSIIYMKNKNEILFSNKNKINFDLTGFSLYSKYGIKIYPLKYYYYYPSKNIGLRDIFIHSLLIVEKEKEVQDIIFLSLFYLKYKEKLNNIDSEILDNLKIIFKGGIVNHYPSLDEIQEWANMYDIDV